MDNVKPSENLRIHFYNNDVFHTFASVCNNGILHCRSWRARMSGKSSPPFVLVFKPFVFTTLTEFNT